MSHAAARQIDASGYRVDERRSEALQREVDADRRIEIADVGAVQEMVAMMTESPAHVADRPGDHSKVFVDRSQVALPDDLEAKLKETHRKAEAKWDAFLGQGLGPSLFGFVIVQVQRGRIGGRPEAQF